MNFNEMWDDQKRFNENFIRIDGMSMNEKQQQTKDYILLMISELDEVLREIDYKHHRQATNEIIISNIYEEIIDVFKYWMSLAQLWGLNPETVAEQYVKKSAVVEQRYRQEFQLDLLAESSVIGVDIDGVLSDYPKCFQDFILAKTGVWIDIKGYDIYDQYAAVLGRGVAENLKKQFRESGQKRYIPVINGAKNFLERMSNKGYKIVLLTSRPVTKYKRIFADTMYWLKENGLIYDAIIWSETKNYDAIKRFPNMKFMVEDNLKFATGIANLGYKVYLVDKEYNQTTNQHKNIIRIKNLMEIQL